MKHINIIIISLLFTSCLYGEENLYPIKVNNNYGFINYYGELIIEPIYSKAGTFFDDIATVMLDDKWLLINKEERVISEVDADYLSSFSDGLALIRRNGKMGYINTSGETVIDCTYYRAQPFSEGRAVVSKGYDENFIETFFYIDKLGKNLNDQEYLDANSFNEGYAIVEISNDQNGVYRALIDINGNEILHSPKLKIVGNYLNSGLLLSIVDDEYCFIDVNGEVIIRCGDFNPEEIIDGLFINHDQINQKSGIMDLNSNWIISPKFEYIYGLSEGFFFFTVDELSGIYSLEKGEILEPTFHDITSFKEGMAHFEPRDGLNGGYINSQGDIFYGKDYY